MHNPNRERLSSHTVSIPYCRSRVDSSIIVFTLLASDNITKRLIFAVSLTSKWAV
jgi:hypothetical protein